jgi:hypothetical protein
VEEMVEAKAEGVVVEVGEMAEEMVEAKAEEEMEEAGSKAGEAKAAMVVTAEAMATVGGAQSILTLTSNTTRPVHCLSLRTKTLLETHRRLETRPFARSKTQFPPTKKCFD